MIKLFCERGVTSPFAQNCTLARFQSLLAFQHGCERGLCNADRQQVVNRFTAFIIEGLSMSRLGHLSAGNEEQSFSR